MFFQDVRGHYYPIAAITWITSLRKRETYPTEYHRVSMRDLDDVEIDPATFIELTQHTIGIVPAEPGTKVVEVDSDLSGVWRVPVIAWAIGSDGVVRPVTPRGINNDYMPQDVTPLVEMPDGRIHGGDDYHHTADTMLDQRRRERDHAAFYSAYSNLRSAQQAYTEKENTQETVDDLAAAKAKLLSIESQTRDQVLLKVLVLRDVVSRDQLDEILDQAEASLNHVR